MTRNTALSATPAADSEPVPARYYVVPALVWGGLLAALVFAAYVDTPAVSDASLLTQPARVLPVAA